MTSNEVSYRHKDEGAAMGGQMPFEEQIVHDKQDLTWLSWSKVRNSSGTAGSFLKAYSDLGGEKTYYKLSDYDAVRGIVGHESVNELIVDRLLTILGVDHLSYQLVHADILIDGKRHETWLCASKNFRRKDESKLALDAFYQAQRQGAEGPLEFCIRNGWAEYIWQMLAVDYLILNRDRHGANIEVLRDPRKKTLRLAPLFDHGLSLLFSCHDEAAVRAADCMEDKPVQCFVGSHSTRENLNLIPAGNMPCFNPLQPEDCTTVTSGLEDAIGEIWRKRIWEMIWKRWCTYEGIRNRG